MATATAGLYLCSGLGMVLGVAGASAVQVGTVRSLLAKVLEGVPGSREVSFPLFLRFSRDSRRSGLFAD